MQAHSLLPQALALALWHVPHWLHTPMPHNHTRASMLACRAIALGGLAATTYFCREEGTDVFSCGEMYQQDWWAVFFELILLLSEYEWRAYRISRNVSEGVLLV